MSKQVITFVADGAYLDHARYALVNCRRQGGWVGDFCIVSPKNCEGLGDFEQRGVHVLRVPVDEWSFLIKFHLFTPYFGQWQQCLCLDLDIMVQALLQPVFDRLSEEPSRIFCPFEEGDTLVSLKQWDEIAGEGPEAHLEVYKLVEKTYPHVRNRMYNASFLFYTPRGLPDGLKDELYAVHERFKVINPSNADQMILNLHLYDRLKEADKNCTCFFGCDEPGNRVVSEYRGWDGTEVPVILHYTRWHAPWIEKYIYPGNDEMGGYQNCRLGCICHELYAENLASFEEEFPIL